jgi:hypothetical protein
MSTLDKEKIRAALGLQPGTSDDKIIAKLAERVGVTSPTPTAEQATRWSMPIDPSAVQPSNITLSEAQTELTDLFKRLTEANPDGMSLAELDQMEATIARHPHLYEKYRRMATQPG